MNPRKLAENIVENLGDGILSPVDAEELRQSIQSAIDAGIESERAACAKDLRRVRPGPMGEKLSEFIMDGGYPEHRDPMEVTIDTISGSSSIYTVQRALVASPSRILTLDGHVAGEPCVAVFALNPHRRFVDAVADQMNQARQRQAVVGFAFDLGSGATKLEDVK